MLRKFLFYFINCDIIFLWNPCDGGYNRNKLTTHSQPKLIKGFKWEISRIKKVRCYNYYTGCDWVENRYVPVAAGYSSNKEELNKAIKKALEFLCKPL